MNVWVKKPSTTSGAVLTKSSRIFLKLNRKNVPWKSQPPQSPHRLLRRYTRKNYCEYLTQRFQLVTTPKSIPTEIITCVGTVISHLWDNRAEVMRKDLASILGSAKPIFSNIPQTERRRFKMWMTTQISSIQSFLQIRATLQ